MFPLYIPDSRWLYICLAYSTSRTPNLLKLGSTGIIKDSKTLLTIEIELNGVMQNGNPLMQAFMDWIKINRFSVPAADSFDYFVQ